MLARNFEYKIYQPLLTPSSELILSRLSEIKATESIFPTITIDVLDKKAFNNAQPTRILAIDLDDTLLNCHESQQQKKVVLKDPEIIKSLLTKAKDNNMMIVIVTSRYYLGKTLMPQYFNIDEVLAMLGKDFFTAVYYTNSQSKVDSLIELNNRFFPKDQYGSRFHDICLVDDSKVNLDPCYHQGFNVIDITKEGALSKIDHFLTIKQDLEISKSIQVEEPSKKRKRNSLFKIKTSNESSNDPKQHLVKKKSLSKSEKIKS